MRLRTLLGGSALAVVAVLSVGQPAFAQEGEAELIAEEEAIIAAEDELIEAIEHAEEAGVFASEFDFHCAELLAEGGEINDCQEAPNPILPEVNEIIWGGMAFLILFVVMWKFALPPVRQIMKDREERIRDDLDRAETAKVEADQVLTDYQAQLADARNEASRIIEEARASAETVAADVKARAEADAAEVRSRAETDASHAAERAMADLQGEVSELSIALAEKIVGRNLDRETQMQLVESYIDEVGRN